MKWKEDARGETVTAYRSRAVGGLYRISWSPTQHPLSPDRGTTYYLYWRERGVWGGRLIGHAFSLAEAKHRAETHHARLRAAINAALGG
jgi:hypothetical protein